MSRNTRAYAILDALYDTHIRGLIPTNQQADIFLAAWRMQEALTSESYEGRQISQAQKDALLLRVVALVQSIHTVSISTNPIKF